MTRELLESSDPHRRRLGATSLSTMPPPAFDEALPAAIDAYQHYGFDWFLLGTFQLRTLGGSREPRLASLFTDLLNAQRANGAELADAIYGLRGMGSLAAPDLPRLRELASSHWSSNVRNAASAGYEHVSHTRLAAAPSRCPVAVSVDPPGASMDDDSTWTVTLHDSTVVLRSAKSALSPAPAAVCPKGVLSAAAVGDECLVAQGGFECGGSLEVWRGTQKTLLNDSPGALVGREHDVLFIEACAHGVGRWSVSSLSKRDGAWSFRPIAAENEAAVIAFSVHEASVDLLVVQDWNGALPCASAQKRTGISRSSVLDAGLVLLRVADDGTVQALE
jgi:hypothetical protein